MHMRHCVRSSLGLVLESKLCILETNTWLGVGFGDDVLRVVRFLVIKRDWSVGENVLCSFCGV